MPEQTVTQEQAAPVTTTEQKPAEVVADAASQQEAEESTLLGQEEEKSKEGIAPPAKNVPEKYEFKAPEGMTIAPETIETFTPVFKELGLDQVQAQKLIDISGPYITKQVTAAVDAAGQANLKVFQDMVKEWGAESKKELGADYQKKLSVVSKVMDRSGVKGIRELMNETGVGNHPAMIKFMTWVGEQFGQDTLADSGKKISDDPNAVARRMFPTMEK